MSESSPGIPWETMKAKALAEPGAKDVYIGVLEMEMCRLENESAGRLRAIMDLRRQLHELERKLNNAYFVRIPAGDWQRIMGRLQLSEDAVRQLHSENVQLRLKARFKAA